MESSETEVSVYYCFARSGGTLINRCLGCIPGNLVLSEVNPMGSIATVESQATRLAWFGRCWRISAVRSKDLRRERSRSWQTLPPFQGSG